MINGGADQIFIIIGDREVIFIDHAFGGDFCCKYQTLKAQARLQMVGPSAGVQLIDCLIIMKMNHSWC
jgi:hypothetical protein